MPLQHPTKVQQVLKKGRQTLFWSLGFLFLVQCAQESEGDTDSLPTEFQVFLETVAIGGSNTSTSDTASLRYNSKLLVGAGLTDEHLFVNKMYLGVRNAFGASPIVENIQVQSAQWEYIPPTPPKVQATHSLRGLLQNRGKSSQSDRISPRTLSFTVKDANTPLLFEDTGYGDGSVFFYFGNLASEDIPHEGKLSLTQLDFSVNGVAFTFTPTDTNPVLVDIVEVEVPNYLFQKIMRVPSNQDIEMLKQAIEQLSNGDLSESEFQNLVGLQFESLSTAGDPYQVGDAGYVIYAKIDKGVYPGEEFLSIYTPHLVEDDGTPEGKPNPLFELFVPKYLGAKKMYFFVQVQGGVQANTPPSKISFDINVVDASLLQSDGSDTPTLTLM